MTLGSRVYGLGVAAMGVVCLRWGGFDQGQAVPAHFPGRTTLAYAVAVFMVGAGAAVMWRRTASWAAAALAVYFGLVVAMVMDGRLVAAHPGVYGTYDNVAEQLAIAGGGLVVYAGCAGIDAVRAARLARVGQVAFGVCAVLFGGAHFAYLNLTVPLVPRWLPPSALFWAYATGIAHIAAGVAILIGLRARRAAILLAVMYASFTPLVHVPALLAAPANRFAWSENALNIALTGVAWVVAESLGAHRRA